MHELPHIVFLIKYVLLGRATELSVLFFFFLIYLFIYLFLAALALRCCAWAFSSCGKQGLLFVVVHRLLLLWSTGSRHAGSVVVARRL